MRNKAVLFAILLAFPLISFGVAKAIQGKYESEWASIIMGRIALATAAFGLSLIGVISFAGWISQKNRKLLLILFAPGFYLMIIAVIILIILQAGLAMAAIFYVVSMWINVMHGLALDLLIYLFVALLVGAIIGIVGMSRGLFSIAKRATTLVVGKRLDAVNQLTLFKFVNDLSRRIEALSPQHIVVGLYPNFFVTQTDVHCLDGKLMGATMYLSLPLCRILTRDEFGAVIAHELGHYKGLDTQYSQKFYPIYKGTSESLVALGQELGGANGIILLPAYAIISFFWKAFSEAESKIGRERELAADRVASECAGRQSLGAALVKMHAFSRYWDSLRQDIRQALSRNAMYTNVSSLFAQVVRSNSQRTELEGLDGQGPPHPTNSHPPLSVRLQALDLSVSSLADIALRTSPDSMAIELITDYEEVEKGLTKCEHDLMVQSGRSSHF